MEFDSQCSQRNITEGLNKNSRVHKKSESVGEQRIVFCGLLTTFSFHFNFSQLLETKQSFWSKRLWFLQRVFTGQMHYSCTA